MSEIAFVVLAGGKSVRMGQDKATMKLSCLPSSFLFRHDYLAYGEKDISVFDELDFLWQPLWTFSKLIKKVPYADSKIYLSCRKEQGEFFREHIAKYPDIAPVEFIFDGGNGVCDALAACLDYLKQPIFCLPCDAPFVTEENILVLLGLWRRNTCGDIWQFTFVDPVNGRKETIISVYEQGAKQAFETAMRQKIRVQNALSDEHCCLVPFSGNLRRELFNLNSPADLGML